MKNNGTVASVQDESFLVCSNLLGAFLLTFAFPYMSLTVTGSRTKAASRGENPTSCHDLI
jgi:hypothetical protein